MNIVANYKIPRIPYFKCKYCAYWNDFYVHSACKECICKTLITDAPYNYRLRKKNQNEYNR